MHGIMRVQSLVFVLSLLLTACDETGASSGDGGPVRDASDDATADAPSEDLPDGDIPDASGIECAFNRECPASERCACDLETGCFCEYGPRGTGQVGVDMCEDGNDCASSVCAEGPGGLYYCSDGCDDGDDCEGALPICAEIAFVGKICVRAGDD
jgi:hypothetical protein